MTFDTLIWNDLCQTLFLYFYSIFLFLTLNAWAASTMNQSDIRGLAFQPEPTVIFSVASFAFFGHEFGSSEINLSYRVVASSFVVPTLLSIIIIPELNHKNNFGGGLMKKNSSHCLHIFSCLILCNCKPYEACQFSGYGDV